MNRFSFLKCIGFISFSPALISKIKCTPIKDDPIKCYNKFKNRGGMFEGGFSTMMMEGGKTRDLYSFSFDHQKQKGEYTAYLKDGRKITFPVYKYDLDGWKKQYDYLSEIE